MLDIKFLINGCGFGFSACSILNMSWLCLLAFTISDDKSAVNLIGVPFYVGSHFSLDAFKIFSCNIFNLLCQSVGIISFLLEFVEILGCEFVHQIWEVFTFYLFEYFSVIFSPSYTLSHYVGAGDGLPHFSEALFIFLHLFTLVFFRLRNFPSSLCNFPSSVCCYFPLPAEMDC